MRLTDISEGVAGPKNCWPGHRKIGTQPGTGKNAGKRVNKCEKIKESVNIEDTYKGWKFEVEFQKEDDRNVTFYSAISPEGKTHMLPKRATKEQFRQFVDSKTVKEGQVTKTKTGIIHRATDKYGAGETGLEKDAMDLTALNKYLTGRLDKSMGVKHDHGNKRKTEEGLGDEVNPADVGEYDREGDMAKQDLATAADAANELRSILNSDENLPEWVQAKITKAVDYLDTARDYMKSKEQGVTERVRDPEDWDEGTDKIPNNIEVSINGRSWKVFAGRGLPDSQEERNHLNKMKQWAASKSAATGKQWEVRLTGAPISR